MASSKYSLHPASCVTDSVGNFKTVKKALGQVCLELKLSKDILKDADMVLLDESIDGKIREAQRNKFVKKKGKKERNYVAVPMAADMEIERNIITSIFPNVKIIPRTTAKHQNTIFTKVKDETEHRFLFEKVVTWKCSAKGCTDRFVAVARDNSLAITLKNITDGKKNPYYNHWVEEHETAPPYPAS